MTMFPSYPSPSRPDIEQGFYGKGSESDPALWGLWRFHQGPDCVEYPAELGVIPSFKSIHFAGQFLVGYEHPPHPDKRPHYRDIYLNRARAIENPGEHSDTLLGENVGKVSASTP